MRSVVLAIVLVTCAAACAKDPDSEGTAGTSGHGGTKSTGGAKGSGGVKGTGGTSGPPPAVDCTDVSGDSGPVTGASGGKSIALSNDPNKTYIMQANWWGSPYSNQSETVNGLGFSIASAGSAPTSNPSNPLGYPSIFIGSYAGKTTKGSNLPKQVSALTSVPTIFSTNADQKGIASYNAAYDVWFTASGSPLSNSQYNPGAGGAYLMVWLFKPSDKQPRGTIRENGRIIDGVDGGWDVWYDGTNPPCVSYVASSKVSSLEFDLNKFIQDAVKNQYGVTSSQYLSIVFAGFEIWSGGDGLEVKQFCANVN